MSYGIRGVRTAVAACARCYSKLSVRACRGALIMHRVHWGRLPGRLDACGVAPLWPPQADTSLRVSVGVTTPTGRPSASVMYTLQHSREGCALAAARQSSRHPVAAPGGGPRRRRRAAAPPGGAAGTGSKAVTEGRERQARLCLLWSTSCAIASLSGVSPLQVTSGSADSASAQRPSCEWGRRAGRWRGWKGSSMRTPAEGGKHA